MINLIKIEWHRLVKLRILPVLLLLAVYFSYIILDKLFGNSIDTVKFLSSGQATFANSFSTNTTIFGPVILAGYFLGSDFTQRTLQQQVANGHTRKTLVLAKVIVFSFISLVLMMITTIVTTGIVTLIKGWGADFTIETVSYMLRVCLLTSLLAMSSVSIYLLISFVCKDIFKTVLFSALFTILFIELGGILVKDGTFFGDFYNFFPLNQVSAASQVHLPMKDLVKMLFSSIVTWVTMIGLTIIIFEKQDLN